MNPKLKNVLAVLAGVVGGSLVNSLLIQTGHRLMPIPGINPEDMEALKAVMPTLEFKYFIFPFLAHALGTLTGATLAARIAATHKMKFAWGIGVLFLIGGIVACVMFPAPVWFIAADLILAYLPMAWIGGRIGLRLSKGKAENGELTT